MKNFYIYRGTEYKSDEVKADGFEINQNGDLILFIDTKAVQAYAEGFWLQIGEF